MDQEAIFNVLGDATLKSVANVSDWNEAILYVEHQEKSVGFKSAYVNLNQEEIRIHTEVDYFTSKTVKE